MMNKEMVIALLLFTGLSFGFILGYLFRPSFDRIANRLDKIYLRRLIHQRDRRIAYLETILRKADDR
jgi:hypothetical protein